MTIVLDTNVLVSGLLSPFSAAGEIVRMVASGILELCYDARLLSEYRSVLLRPKFCFDRVYLDYLLEQLKAAGRVVAVKPLAKRLPDPDDEPFLEVALAGQVRCLITGNLKHYPLERREGMEVLTPAQFLETHRGKL